jgi:hypothetical protein
VTETVGAPSDATDPADGSRPADPATSAAATRRAAWVLLGALAVLFLVVAWPRITAPFADSDEGINGAVWGYDSRSLRELGIVDSRLGGLRLDGSRYATHPPLIVVQTAAAEVALGEHPWSSRLPAWGGTLAAIVLLWFLVRSLGLDELTAAAAVVCGTATHLLTVYGLMLDTPVTSFPFGLAVALVWHRQWQAPERRRPWVAFAVSLVAALSGWQAGVLVAVCAFSLAARIRRRPGAFGEALPFLAGGLLGLGLDLGWTWWAHDGFGVLQDKFGERSGGETDVSVGDMVGFQLPWLAQLLGLSLAFVVAAVVSLRDRRFRPLAALSLGIVAGYALLFREAAGGHQYWNYWALLPATVGAAYVLDGLVRALRSSGTPTSTRTAVVVLGAICVVVAAVNLTARNEAGQLIDDGQRPYEVVLAGLPADQTTLPYVAEPYRPDFWLLYHDLPPGEPIQSAEQLRSLAAERPDDLALVLGSCAEPDPTGICTTLTFGNGGGGGSVEPRLVPLGELAAALAPTEPGGGGS